MIRHSSRRAAAIAFVTATTAACNLPDAPGFGARCTGPEQCEGSLVCSVGQGRCLPPEPPEAPDLRGRACDDPVPFALVANGPLVRGSLSVPFAADSPERSTCGAGPAMVFSIDVPTQTGSDGQTRNGMVLRVLVDAPFEVSISLADESCQVVDPLACASTRASAEPALLLPTVSPGSYRLLIAANAPDTSAPITIEVEQVLCPFGFLPDGQSCIGFVAVGETEPRTGHSVAETSDGSIVVIGGRDADDQAIDTYDLLAGREQVTLPLGVAMADHAIARIVTDEILVVGGQQGPHAASDSFVMIGATAERAFHVYAIDFTGSVGTSAGCAVGPVGDERALLVVCPDHAPALFSEAYYAEGFECTDDFDCEVDEVCVARYDDGIDGGVCVCSAVSCEPEGAGWRTDEIVPRDGLADEGHVVIQVPQAPRSLLVAGGLAPGDGAPVPARPYIFSVDDFGFRSTVDALSLLPALVHPVALELGGQVLMVGGRAPDGTPSAQGAVFAAVGTSAPTAVQLAVPRAEATAFAIDDERVVVVGGRNDGGLLASTEIVNLATATTHVGPRLPVALADARAIRAATATLIVGGRTAMGPNGTLYELVRVGPSLDAPSAEPIVRIQGDSCEAPQPLVPSTSYVGSTFDLFDQIDLDDVPGCADARWTPGNEAVFSVDVPAGARLSARVRPLLTADVVVAILSSCDDGMRCLALGDADSSFTLAPEEAIAPASKTDRTLFIVVDNAGLDRFDFILDVTFEGL